jgi:hypothetical protein
VSLRIILMALLTLGAAGAQAKKISVKKSIFSPDVILEMKTSDGYPIEDVALTGMIHYSVISLKNCPSGFITICTPSLPHRIDRSGAGEVLGYTDSQGILKMDPIKWVAKEATAKDLSVSFFTNGTVGVDCSVPGEEDAVEVGFIDTLPQWQGEKLTTRTPECSTQIFSEKDKGLINEVRISCVSPLTKADIDSKIADLKAKCPQSEKTE